MTKISVLGSCVSRISLLRGYLHEHGIVDGEKNNVELEYFFDKHNLALALLPPPFPREEVEEIVSEMLWDKSRDKSLRQQLNKDTVPMLLDGEAEYLVIDLYDFHNYILSYQDTAFCTQANEFLKTPLFDRHVEELIKYNLLEMPTWVVYPMVDRFFECIIKKFDSDHIILNRFRANKYMLYENGQIGYIPDICTRDFQCNEKYNTPCAKLEEHIINKFNPWVIDISRFFMGDANLWDNWNASHFEKEFYRETYDQIIRIVNGQTNCRYYDKVQFFNKERDGYKEDFSRKYDVEHNIEVMKILMEDDDDLWINVLEQCYIRQPDNEELKEYIKAFGLA